MSLMYSQVEIRAAARARGHGEAEIQRILAGIQRLKDHGLVRTGGGDASVGLTREGRQRVAQLRAQGVIPARR